MKSYKILMLAISLVVFFGVIILSNPFVIADRLSNSNHAYIAAAFGLSFVALCLGTLKWHVLLNKLKRRELFPVQILGYTISNFTPGKVGEPAKAVLLKMRADIAVSYSLTSIIWERVLDVVVLVCLSLAAISIVSVSSDFFIPSLVSVFIFGLIVAVSLAVLHSEKFGRRIFSFVRKFPLLKRLPEKFMDMFYKSHIDRKRIFASLIITAITWFVIGLVLFVSLLAFGVQVSPLATAGIVALSIVIGIASSLPGGVGTTELVMIFLLGVLGVEPGTAAAATITFRLATIWFTNILGGLSFIYLSRKFDVKKIFR